MTQAEPDYVQASRLETTILRPKKTTLTFSVTPSEWEALWHLERPVFSGREIPSSACVPCAFKLTLVSLPRRTAASDLTVAFVIELARGEIGLASSATAGDRTELGRRVLGRGEVQVDNRRHGTDRNRGRD